MRKLKNRKDIVIQGVDKAGAVAIMEKGWYKKKMKEQIVEGYKIIGKNTRKEKEELISNIIEKSEEGYGEKRLRNKRRKYLDKKGTIPRMKGLPKTHKEVISLRPVVNGRGSVLERLEEEMAKVLKIVEMRQERKRLKNSEELVEEWKDIVLEEEEILFSLDVEKMYTSLKREQVKKEIKEIIKEEEVIRGWKKVEIIKNLEFVWDNTYCVVDDEIVKIEEGLGIGSRMSPVLAEILMKR